MSTPSVSQRWQKVSARSWSRFEVRHLTIAPSLAGASLSFDLDAAVEIRLPQRPKKTPDVRRGAHWGNDNISCYGSSSKTGRAVNFTVHTVDVIVDIKKRVSVPGAAFERIKTSLFTETEQQRLDKLTYAGHAVAIQAVERWLRVLRWKSLMGHLGHTEAVGRRSGWAPRLLDAQTRRHFYSTGHTITLTGSFNRSGVSPSQWRKTEQALRQKLEAPVWFDFLFEGQHRLGGGDLHAAVLCLAIAAESVIRVLLTNHLKRPANAEVIDLLNRANIGSVLDRWKDLGFWSAAWQAATDLPKIRRLFDLRNGIMHRGDRASVHQAECGQIAVAVRAFILHAARTADRLQHR
jgi:hypothetical protein